MTTSLVLRSGRILAFMVLVAAAAIGLSSSPLSAAATLSITPVSGPPGTAVTAAGGGFRPGEPVVVRWTLTGAVLTRTTADAGGRVTGSFTAPNPVEGPGIYTIWALGDESGLYATAEFTLTGAGTPEPPPPPPPSPSPPPSPPPSPGPSPSVSPSPSPTPTPAPPNPCSTEPALGPPALGENLLPGGPLPSAGAPNAVAVDGRARRLYAVHRPFYLDQAVSGLLPTDRVSVLDQDTGAVVAVIPIGKSLQGSGQGLAVDSERRRLYVSNSDEDTVCIIDTAQNRVAGMVRPGAGPQGIAADSAAGRVYVATSQGRSLTILDASSGAIITSTSLPGEAHAVAVDPSSRIVYLTLREPPWAVLSLDGATGAILSRSDLTFLTSPVDLAVDPGSRVYVADHNGVVAALDIAGTALVESHRFRGGDLLGGVAVDTESGNVLVSDLGAATVGVFDRAGTRTGSFSTQRMPARIATDTVSGRAYVSNAQSASLSVLDLRAGVTAGMVPLGTVPEGIAVDVERKRLYVANLAADSISVVDPSSRRVLATWVTGPSPWALAMDEKRQQVYVLNLAYAGRRGGVTVHDAVNGSVKAILDVEYGDVGALAIDPPTGRVYVASGSRLTVVDGTANGIVATLPAGDRASGVAVDETGRRVYVASQQRGTISIVDADTNQVLNTWTPDLPNLWGVAVDAQQRRLYVTMPRTITGAFTGVGVLDLDSGAVIAQTATADGAELVAADPARGRAFVTDDNGTVTIVDATSGAVIARVPAGSGPNALAVHPVTGVAYVANARDGTISVVSGPGGTPGPAPGGGCPGLASVPGAPVLLSPCGTLAGFEADLRWTNPDGATQVEIRVAPFQNDGPGVHIIANVGGKDGRLLLPAPPAWYGLLPDMTYTWSVRTSPALTSLTPDDPRWGPWSPGGTFRTPKADSSTITPVSPPDGGTVSGPTPSLEWQDRAPGIWYYEVQVSADPNFGPGAFLYWELRHGGVTVPKNSYAIPSAYPLTPGGTYHWRVRPRVQGDGTPVAWSPAWRFTVPGGVGPPPAPQPSPGPVPPAPDVEVRPEAALGTWRVVSARLYYDDGRSSPDQVASYGSLELTADGPWRYGTSSGSWRFASITQADWERWGIEPYTATRKIVLDGWDGTMADGPAEETGTTVHFLWSIYRTGPPTISAPGTIWLKWGR